MSNFIVDPSSISYSKILADLKSFIDAAPDSAKWKDFFESSTGTIITQMIAGVSTFFTYNVTVARRESFIRYAQNRSSAVAAGQSLGYSSFRGRNAVIKLTITPNVTAVWPKWTVIGSVKDKSLILESQAVVNAGVSIQVNVIVGETNTQDLIAQSAAPSSFRFDTSGVSQDIRVFLNNTTELTTSEKLLDLINEKFVTQSNVFGSVDVLYLNLSTFLVTYTTGNTISLRWIALSNPTFVLSDLKFDYGVLTASEFITQYQDPETTTSIQINAPLFNETQFVIRGREDYKKLVRLTDTSVVSTATRDISPAVVAIYYVRTALRLFSASEKNNLIIKLSSYRSLGLLPPIIADPQPNFLSVKSLVTMNGVGNIATDTRTILSKYESVLEQAIEFPTIEETTEQLSYVKVARISFNPGLWSASNLLRRGVHVVPISPSISQAQYVYEMSGKLYKSGVAEPTWSHNIGDFIYDELPITSGGTRARITYSSTVYSAASPGLPGNHILLTFDGVKTNKQVVNGWNEINPLNLAYIDSGSPTAVSPVATVRIGVAAGAAAAGALPAGGSDGINHYTGAEPTGGPSGFYRIGTGMLWEVKALSCLPPPVWQPNTRYSIGDQVSPSSGAITADPLLAGKILELVRYVNRSAKDSDASSALGSYGGVSFMALNPGSIGNAISMNFNGTDTVSIVVSAWNVANPGNKVHFYPAASGSSVLASGGVTLSNGSGAQATGSYGGASFTFVGYGVSGNGVSLVFNGTDSVGTVVDDWNTANPSSQVFAFPLSALSNVPTAGTLDLSGGVSGLNLEPIWPTGPVIC